MSTSPEQVVREFCAAWSRLDVDELMQYFTDDAVYHNMPVEPARGVEAIRKTITQFSSTWEATTWDILAMASDGNVLFAERVDRIDSGGRHLDLPVTGVFEIQDGKIAAWRDYFDIATYSRALMPERQS